VPAVVVYRVSGLAWVVQSWFRHARFFTLVNLLAAREPIGATQPVWWPPVAVPPADAEMVYPEYLAVQDPAEQAAGHVVAWLTDPVARDRTLARIEAVARGVVRPGSAARAAEVVIDIAARAAKAAPARGRRAA
jgi:hypothetical protein